MRFTQCRDLDVPNIRFFASSSIWPEICFNATNRIFVACIESKLNHSLKIKTTLPDLDCKELVKCFLECLLILKTIVPPVTIDLSLAMGVVDGDHSWVVVFPSDFHEARIMSLLTVNIAGRAHDAQQQTHSSDLEVCISEFISLSLYKTYESNTGEFTVSMIVVAALCAVSRHISAYVVARACCSIDAQRQKCWASR